ncbi:MULTISPECIES: GIY-YIG nuclease family protein [Pontibacter]|uniref:T5orf172 domain-containing protein n=1 Tax=Pontibacter virosus TaxID=1765052 RepID=A0A2U1B581_9BACT|nr:MULTISPECIES: GIY-YIG nuclease family protein [Pontibacter]PVY43677.1 T5orf172 domain-containing protein [Pontibacter virosus]
MAKQQKLTEEDDALLAELGIEVEAKKAVKYSPREERIIAGFEEIQKFVEEHNRLPEHGEDRDIFERLYAVRLEQIRRQEECRNLLKELDHQNLLDSESKPGADISEDLDDEELLAQLGVDVNNEDSITNLKHVKPRVEKKAAEEIANRTRCEDFDNFKPLFAAVKRDIDTGFRKTIRFRKDAGFTKTSLKKAQFIIVGGQMAYIAEIGETFKAPNGEEDARLRVIYANGTESNILLRSLIRAMYKDETSRFITDADSGPLFSGENSEDDQESGTIYVLRSLSNHPTIKENREIVHKIGVTGGAVEKRLVNAKNDPTFLMADVEVVATYKLANINRTKLENIIHKFFGAAKLDIELMDRFGKPVKAREWFLVPIFIIDEMVEKIKDGTVSAYYYDPASAELKKH